ncbi:MAG TPA: hypothetical protein VFS67_14135 [Polyangiaceae bacterium]|nr:hypothetical protein [Polyangiaceae bacterium]
MLDRGYLRVVRLRGAELRVHWSVLAAVALAGRLRFEPVIWGGLLAVILGHQLGHALAVAVAGGTLLGLDTTGVGGSCRWRGAGSLLERAWVAWGGMLLQAVLLALALAFSEQLAASPAGSQLRFCFVELNLAILAVNLLPLPPLDGALAWRIFGALRDSRWTRGELRLDGSFGAGAAGSEGPSPPATGAASAGMALGARGVPGNPAADPGYARARATGAPHPYGQAATDDAHAEDEALASPRPSEQAQREIDALLRRMEDKVARSRRGR